MIEKVRNFFTGGHFGDTMELKNILNNIVDRAVTADCEVVAANKTLTEEDCGKTFLCGTDGVVLSLPATKAGLRYTVMNTGARTTTQVAISPVAADGISGTFTLAATAVVVAGVVNKDIQNTKASAEPGDSVEIIGTGVTGTKAWLIKSSTGIWKAE